MKLFTVGPVEMYPETLKIEGMQQPYFRTPEFSKTMLDIEQMFLESIKAPKNAKFLTLTCSGTGAMDAVVLNLLTEQDKVLVINGGSFGARFGKICEVYHIPHDEYKIPYGEAFSREVLSEYAGKGYTALLVNASETSTSQKYDLDYLGTFCRENSMMFIVDAVSAYLADPINMEKQNIDAILTASQKALALAPGLALVALSEKAYDKCIDHEKRTFYFDFVDYIENQKRGQPPFTCAVGTMLALHQRLQRIMSVGVQEENRVHAQRAEYFRSKIKYLPISVPTFPMSNSCTAILFPKNNANTVYENMKEKYGIILTPSGGDWKEKQLRVGHLGNLTLADYDELTEKLERELQQ